MDWTVATYCDALAVEMAQLGSVSRGTAPTTRVPTCPDWTLAQLLEHTGAVHRWVTHMVVHLSPVRAERQELGLQLPDDEQDLPDWIAAGGATLLTALRSADPDAAMWSWGVDQHVRFWPRRMLHETCIHRVDAERAAGVESQVDPEVAADGIEELLLNLPPAERFSPTVRDLRGNGESLIARATDAEVGWRILLHADGFAWERTTAKATDADAGLSGPISDLCLVLNRRLPLDHPGVERWGDAVVLDRWMDNARLG
ncbi:MAG TPA: maleylpyruvate isomerase family mycothiol-dependent enzyme [Acidimicrobiales bacterium]|jgi:uncharacterized protein (TIGR03083 family)